MQLGHRDLRALLESADPLVYRAGLVFQDRQELLETLAVPDYVE